MATVAQGSNQNFTITAGRRLSITTAGEAAIYLLAGATGATQEVYRAKNSRAIVLGPYGADVLVNIVAVSGTATVLDVLKPAALATTRDPITGAYSGVLQDDEGNEIGAIPMPSQVASRTANSADGGVTSFANTDGSFVLFGDSFMARHDPAVLGVFGITSSSLAYWGHANAELEGKLNCVRNAGVSGDTTTQMLARMEAAVKPYRARFLMLEGGVNDTTLTATQTIANMELMVKLGLSWGYIVMLHTPGPWESTAATKSRTSQIASGYRDLCKKYRGCVLVDMYAAMVDPLSTAGNMIAAYSTDAPKLHPSPAGARGIAHKACVPAIRPFLSGNRRRVSSQANSVAVFGAAATQVLPNPLFVLTGGTAPAGVGASGSAPLNTIVRNKANGVPAITSVWSIAAKPADAVGVVWGNSIHVVVAAAALNSAIEVLTDASIHTLVAAGDRLQLEFTVSQQSAANVKGMFLWADVADPVGGTTQQVALYDSTVGYDSSDFVDFVYRSDEFIVPAGITNLRPRLSVTFDSGTGSGTFDFNIVVYKLQA